jgi:hypothetical protein
MTLSNMDERFSLGEWQDLGHGVRARVRYFDGEIDALEYEHSCLGCLREDAIPLQPTWSNGWNVQSLEPITLSPSLLCTRCKLHGFVREGKWVPA